MLTFDFFASHEMFFIIVLQVFGFPSFCLKNPHHGFWDGFTFYVLTGHCGDLHYDHVGCG